MLTLRTRVSLLRNAGSLAASQLLQSFCRLATGSGITHSLKTLLHVPRADPDGQFYKRQELLLPAIPSLCLSSLQHGTQGLQETCNCLPRGKRPPLCQHAAALLAVFLCLAFCRDCPHAPDMPLKCTIPGVRCSSFCIYLVQNWGRGDTLSAVLCTSLELKLQCPGKGSFLPTF